MKAILKFIIRAYALILSPFIGRSCRFTPSCSAYAHEAIDKYGAIKGGWMAVKRILRCHPFNKDHPYDPVP
ncbi:MAG: membrane protein insertion efficiency factor YidD [Alphaproteobacteria bacterium]